MTSSLASFMAYKEDRYDREEEGGGEGSPGAVQGQSRGSPGAVQGQFRGNAMLWEH